jgi:hypothetical protein
MMVGVRQHTGLHDVGTDVGKHGLELLANHIRRNWLDASHVLCFCAVIAVMTEQP